MAHLFVIKVVALLVFALFSLNSLRGFAQMMPFGFWKAQIKIIQSTAPIQSSDTNPTASFAALPKAGNRIIVMLWGWGNDYNYTTGTVTDNQGNTYVRAAATNNGVNFGMGIFVSNPITAPSGTFTITANPFYSGSVQTGGAAIEVSGLAAGTVTDVTSCSSGLTAAPLTNATATTALNNELLVATAVGGRTNPMTWTPAAGWTVHATETNSSAFQGGQALSRIVNTKSTYSHTWALSPSDIWAACIATFRGF